MWRECGLHQTYWWAINSKLSFHQFSSSSHLWSTTGNPIVFVKASTTIDNLVLDHRLMGKDRVQVCKIWWVGGWVGGQGQAWPIPTSERWIRWTPVQRPRPRVKSEQIQISMPHVLRTGRCKPCIAGNKWQVSHTCVSPECCIWIRTGFAAASLTWHNILHMPIYLFVK